MSSKLKNEMPHHHYLFAALVMNQEVHIWLHLSVYHFINNVFYQVFSCNKYVHFNNKIFSMANPSFVSDW